MSLLKAWILAMALYPEVQRQAQKEIENVIGTGRLPEFNDMASLSYIEAIVLETMRWHPVTPLGKDVFISMPMYFPLWYSQSCLETYRPSSSDSTRRCI